MKIQIQLKDIVINTTLVEALDINPYCINEGADPESFMTIEIDSVILKDNTIIDNL